VTRDVDVFFGEFLISPIPLELSLNYCSHVCAYCFANLNDRGRQADIGAVMRFFNELPSRTSLQSHLVREGYPILFSNRVDPFATSNIRLSLPLLEIMRTLDIPVAIQTKGGKGIPEALDLLGPSVWYVSISQLDDTLRKQLEPGAPPIGVRFELIEQLRQRGHTVIVGVNPLVPEWLPGDDLENLLAQAAKAGAAGAWIENLHFNYKQIDALTPAERAALTEPVIQRAKLRKRPADEAAFFYRAREAAGALGLCVFSNGQPTRSDFWQLYRDVYPKTFPTNQDFVNHCHDQGLAGQLLGFETYAEVMEHWLPGGVLPLAHYLGATAHQIWRTHEVPRNMTYRELLAILWQDPRAKQALVRMPNFAFAALRAGKSDWIQLVDENEMPYVVFDPDGFETFYTEVEV